MSTYERTLYQRIGGYDKRRRALTRLVSAAGFEVLDGTAAPHCPRVLAVPGAHAAERVASWLLAWERLADLPSRQQTGHFVVVRGRRC